MKNKKIIFICSLILTLFFGFKVSAQEWDPSQQSEEDFCTQNPSACYEQGSGGDMFNECINSAGGSYSDCQSYYADSNGYTSDTCDGTWENGECYESGRTTDCSNYGPDYVADKNGNCVQVAEGSGNELCTTNAECIADFGNSYFCDQATRMCEERSAESNVDTANGDICYTDSECAWYAKCKLGKKGATGVCQSYTDTTDPQQKIDSLTNGSGNNQSTQLFKTNLPMISNGTQLPAGTKIDLASGNAVLPDGSFAQVSQSDLGLLNSSAKGGSSIKLCANGSLGQICEQSGSGGTPFVLSNAAGGFGNVAGLSGATLGCEAGFEKLGGICFPSSGTTGLSSASIYVILSNLFSWLMGMFTTFAVIAFVISGLQYLTAAGDEKQMETGKKNAKYAIMGIIIGLSGFIIVKAIAAALSGQSIFF